MRYVWRAVCRRGMVEPDEDAAAAAIRAANRCGPRRVPIHVVVVALHWRRSREVVGFSTRGWEGSGRGVGRAWNHGAGSGEATGVPGHGSSPGARAGCSTEDVIDRRGSLAVRCINRLFRYANTRGGPETLTPCSGTPVSLKASRQVENDNGVGSASRPHKSARSTRKSPVFALHVSMIFGGSATRSEMPAQLASVCAPPWRKLPGR